MNILINVLKNRCIHPSYLFYHLYFHTTVTVDSIKDKDNRSNLVSDGI